MICFCCGNIQPLSLFWCGWDPSCNHHIGIICSIFTKWCWFWKATPLVLPIPITSQLNPTKKLSVFFLPHWHLSWDTNQQNPVELRSIQLLCPTRKLSVLCPLSHSSWWLWDWRETGWSSFRIDFTKFHWRVTSIRQRGMSSGSMVIRFQELRSIWRLMNVVQYHLLIYVSHDCHICPFLTTMQKVQW